MFTWLLTIKSWILSIGQNTRKTPKNPAITIPSYNLTKSSNYKDNHDNLGLNPQDRWVLDIGWVTGTWFAKTRICTCSQRTGRRMLRTMISWSGNKISWQGDVVGFGESSLLVGPSDLMSRLDNDALWFKNTVENFFGTVCY